MTGTVLKSSLSHLLLKLSHYIGSPLGTGEKMDVGIDYAASIINGTSVRIDVDGDSLY